ncbi:hypothetical protein M501DRAFT_1000883 [Patellaria atrata CBS 101060]|uniref:Uncharacterized protein n=1 Tax=Patellaria atrata CBS 101060 TaxID=1346257 RepID=A0A9P4VU52_9PEZI|nr:hypothetical protein M501DRAFT_1000883 [Patellaria atrata CBS 101060]
MATTRPKIMDTHTYPSALCKGKIAQRSCKDPVRIAMNCPLLNSAQGIPLKVFEHVQYNLVSMRTLQVLWFVISPQTGT